MKSITKIAVAMVGLILCTLSATATTTTEAHNNPARARVATPHRTVVAKPTPTPVRVVERTRPVVVETVVEPVVVVEPAPAVDVNLGRVKLHVNL